MTEVRVTTNEGGGTGPRNQRNYRAADEYSTGADNISTARMCTCNRNPGARSNYQPNNVTFGRSKYPETSPSNDFDRTSQGRQRTTTKITARPAPNSSNVRRREGGYQPGNGGGTKVVVPPRSCDPYGTTVIELSDAEPGGTYVVSPPNDTGNIQVKLPGSEITISTPRTPKKRTGASSCLRPTECERMQGIYPSERGMALATKQDEQRLQQAVQEALDSCQNLRTFDDVEELLEIHNCNEIQRRLLKLMQDKREKLEKRQARREAELLERKMDFHKNLIQRISDDRREQSKMHQELLKILGDNPQSNGARDEIEVSISRTAVPDYDNFKPQGESTRMMRQRDNDREPRHVKVLMRKSRRASCGCRSDQQTTDISDEPTGGRR